MPDFRPEIKRRLESLTLPPAREMEIVEEISQHLEDRHARSLGLGCSEDDASARAWRELDESNVLGLALARVEPAVSTAPPLGSSLRMFPRDLIHAVRTLAKARTYSFVCITSLGLGIGTVIAILLIVRMAFGTPAGVNPDGLVELVMRPAGQPAGEQLPPILDTWSYPDFEDVRDNARGLALAAWTFGESMLRLPGRGGGAVPVATMYVSANYFTTVGVTLAAGGGFDRSVDAPGALPAVVLGNRLWETRFGSDPSIVGRTITLNQVPHTVVGIAPRGYQLHMSIDGAPESQLWVPLPHHPRIASDTAVRFARDDRWLRVAGRLSTGTDVAQANAAVASIMAGLAARYPESNRFRAGAVEAYSSVGARQKSEIRLIRAMFFGSTGLVLLIVCLNVSGMMLVRSAMRERELSIRLAIGATRGRLMQYLLAEALVLSVMGGALSATLLFGIPAAVTWWFDVWHPDLDLFLPDRWTALQGVALCAITSLVFGLLPAIRFSRPSLVSALKDGSQGGRRVGRFHRLTAAAQAGIAVPFIVVGGVRLDQARVTATADLGFRPEGLFAAPLTPGAASSVDETPAFLDRARQRLVQTPGVTAVTFADSLPLYFQERRARVTRLDDATPLLTRATRTAPGYLDALGIRLLRGRDIGPGDAAGAERVVLLSEPLASRLFPAADPLGQRLALSFNRDRDEREVVTVVGVTADLVGSQMGNPRPQLFVPLVQHPAPNVLAIVRGVAAEASMRTALAEALTDLDPDYVLTNVITGEQLRRESRGDLLVHFTMSSGVAAIALVLTALGVYGVIGFMVATRTREIGVRVALGASRRRVVREILADSLRLVGPGVALGLVLGVVWVRRLDPSWYPLGAVEPLVYAVAAAIACAVALVACLPSARRAAAVQPLDAMRIE